MTLPKEPKMVIYGAGAIGITLATWMTSCGLNASLFARPEKALLLKQKNIQILKGDEEIIAPTTLKIIDHIDSSETIDLLIITVKNFNLEESCQALSKIISPNTIILGLQNGVINQTILPKYFANIVYGIVNYNAWTTDSIDKNHTYNWRVNINGPIIFGTPDNQLINQSREVVSLFSRFIECKLTTHFQDDAHAKLVANLGNAVTTIIGNSHHQKSALIPLQQVLTRLTYEGVKTLKAAGFKESLSSLLPSWRLIMSSKYIPLIFTQRIFRQKLALIGSTSMATDILKKDSGVSELASINGYLLNLAEQHNIDVPYSKRLYKLCERYFVDSPFKAITSEQLKVALMFEDDDMTS
jgi:2-dehydropantoate 2-reductase